MSPEALRGFQSEVTRRLSLEHGTRQLTEVPITRTRRYLGDRGLQAGARGQHSAAGAAAKAWGCGVPLLRGTLRPFREGRIAVPVMDRPWHQNGG